MIFTEEIPSQSITKYIIVKLPAISECNLEPKTNSPTACLFFLSGREYFVTDKKL